MEEHEAGHIMISPDLPAVPTAFLNVSAIFLFDDNAGITHRSIQLLAFFIVASTIKLALASKVGLLSRLFSHDEGYYIFFFCQHTSRCCCCV